MAKKQNITAVKVVLALLVLVLLVGALHFLLLSLLSERGESNGNRQDEPTTMVIDDASGDTYTLEYGKVTVINGWKAVKERSTERKAFFAPASYDGKGVPDNISIEYATNSYALSDSTDFARSIERQLAMQTGVTIKGSGSTTARGYLLLSFEFEIEGTAYRQYYIPGERHHILIYETNFSGSEECAKTAAQMADSFEFN